MDQQQQGPAKPENFRVRPMTSLSEFSLLFEWAVAEGWRPGVYDAETYYNQDPTGYYLAELDGVPIGAIGTIKFGEDLASITQYIVKPPFRGKGYGYRMWQEVLKKIGDRNLVLESVAAQRSNYEKSGFKSSWQTIRFRGVGRTDDHVISNAGDRVTLTSVDKVNFDDLYAFDQKVSVGSCRGLAATIPGESMSSGQGVQLPWVTAMNPQKMANKLKTLVLVLLAFDGRHSWMFEDPQPSWLDICKTDRCSSECYCRNRFLSSVPQDMPTTMTIFYLRDNQITGLYPSDFSKYVRLRRLHLKRNQIDTVKERAFSKLSELRYLDLSENKLKYIHPGTFSGLCKLQGIKLEYNQITDIGTDTFSNLPELTGLILSSNMLTNIRPGTFTNLPKLGELSLYGNRITDIKSGTFSDLPELKDLWLRYNKIRVVQLGAFSNLPKLKQICLGQNNLTSIDPGTFANLTNLRILGLSGNPWNCNCKMANVKKAITESHPHYPASIVFKSQITCEQPIDHKGKMLDVIPEEKICVKPKIVKFENKNGGTLLQGETLPLVCEATGLPKPVITIVLPSGMTPKPSVKSGGRKIATLTISDVTAFDAGQYICIATNAGGSTSEKLYVDVIPEKPKIVRFENKKGRTLMQGETLHLVCEASSLPKPNITIVLPSGLTPRPTVQSGARKIVTLNIGLVTAVDAGQYVCIATNAGGSTSSKLYVEVRSTC
uniref:Ig-like domain-containing protein n=1 Tax=Branchiostoma floridae TaxID=7739 RepID=C3Z263_BRAFL|eukprot:XP_002597102.1 hypothetical protein BRAFLDRAFT_76367 [Branchiostoma floridae]